MQSQCKISGMSIPAWATKWANLRKDFKKAYQRSDPLNDLTVYKMLQVAELEYEGKHYNGRDECFNLALITVNMLRNDHQFNAAESIRG